MPGEQKLIVARMQEGEVFPATEWMDTANNTALFDGFVALSGVEGSETINPDKVKGDTVKHIYAGQAYLGETSGQGKDSLSKILNRHLTVISEDTDLKNQTVALHFLLHNENHYTQLIITVQNGKISQVEHVDSLYDGKKETKTVDELITQQIKKKNDDSLPAPVITTSTGAVKQTDSNNCGVIVASALFQRFATAEQKTQFPGMLIETVKEVDKKDTAVDGALPKARLEIARQLRYNSLIDEAVNKKLEEDNQNTAKTEKKTRDVALTEIKTDEELLGKIKAQCEKIQLVTAENAKALGLEVGDICDVEVRQKMLKKKADAAAKDESKSTTPSPVAIETADVLKGLAKEAKIEIMKKVFAEAKTSFEAIWSGDKSTYSAVTLALTDTDKAGKPLKGIATSDTECKVHMTATFTKTDNTTEKADITLTRTATADTVVRRCETESKLITWSMQCELMAKQSITERQEAAKTLGKTADLRVAVSLECSTASKVKDQMIGNVKTSEFTADEATLINAYLKAGYKEVHCQGKMFTLTSSVIEKPPSVLPGVFPPPASGPEVPSTSAPAPK